jgi:hypothetical protein
MKINMLDVDGAFETERKGDDEVTSESKIRRCQQTRDVTRLPLRGLLECVFQAFMFNRYSIVRYRIIGRNK